MSTKFDFEGQPTNGDAFVPSRDDPKIVRARLIKHPKLSNWYGVTPEKGWDNEADIAQAKQRLQDMNGLCTRSNADEEKIQELAQYCRELGISEKMAVELIITYNKPPFSKPRVELQVWKHYEYSEDKPGLKSMADTTPGRPIITYDMIQLPTMLDHVCRTLRPAKLYRMEDRLVHVFNWERASEEDDNLRRDPSALVVDNVDEHALLQFMIEQADFVKYDGKQNPKMIAPPMSLATHVLSAKSKWKFRTLKGVITAPTLRDDGSLLAEEGYDRKSELFLDLGGTKYPEIPEKLTKRDAMKALEALKEPFEEFPFVQEDDFTCPSLSVALSAILTGLIRRTLPTAPLHGFDAPEAGSGKGLACNVVTMIVTGHRATMLNYSTSETEFRKLLFSALLANDQVIVLDNVTRPLEGDLLCSALAEQTIGDRILGVSKNAEVPTSALFMATGNNLQVKGDMRRRIVAARIDAGERPEQRGFKRANLLTWVEENRPALVAAGLTILRAYEAAGRPDVGLTPYGSFEAWSARVRSALVWLGEDDPCATVERFHQAEPESEALGEVIRALYAEFEGKWFTAADVEAKTNEMTAEPNPVSLALQAAEVPEMARELGKYLAKNKDRTKDGLKLCGGYDSKAHRNTFRITKV